MKEERLPLRGKHVLITRGGEQGEKFCTDVASAGGIPYMVPLIDFRLYNDQNATYFMNALDRYDWIIFTSRNGVNYFFKHIEPIREQFELLKDRIHFAAVGEKTRAELKRYHIESHFMPNIYTAEDFSREYFQKDFSGKRVLIPKGNLASTTIADSFRARNIVADEWIIYETYYPTKHMDRLVQVLREDRLDIVCFTSPSTFNHFMKVVKQYHLQSHAEKLTIATIGKVTKRAVEREGYTVHICPDTYTIDEMFAEICRVCEDQKKERKN